MNWRETVFTTRESGVPSQKLCFESGPFLAIFWDEIETGQLVLLMHAPTRMHMGYFTSMTGAKIAAEIIAPLADWWKVEGEDLCGLRLACGYILYQNCFAEIVTESHRVFHGPLRPVGETLH